jgi:choline-sulfatase
VEVSAAEIETLRALYDEQIGFVDAAVGEVLDRLRRSGAYDDTLIVLTADHGDAFLEHGALAHSTTPYEELVRVPLVLKLPANRHAGREITVPVRLVDVLPTLLDLLGRRAPRGVDGCSLRPLLEGEEAAWPVECATAVIEIAEDPGLYPAVALRTERWKYIHRDGGPDELYDLAADPGERTNLLAAEDPPGVAEELRQRALAVAASRPAAGERVELDAATIEELKALGYL